MIKRTLTEPGHNDDYPPVSSPNNKYARKMSSNNSYLEGLEKRLSSKNASYNNNGKKGVGRDNVSGYLYEGYANKNKMRNARKASNDYVPSTPNSPDPIILIQQPCAPAPAPLQPAAQLPPPALTSLTQFIEYHLQKQQSDHQKKQHYLKQIQLCQEEIKRVEQEIEYARMQVLELEQFCAGKLDREEIEVGRLGGDIKATEEETRGLNKLILGLKEKNHSNNNLAKKINQLKDKKYQQEQKNQQAFQKHRQKHIHRQKALTQETQNLRRTIAQYQKQMQTIQKIKQSIKQKREKIQYLREDNIKSEQFYKGIVGDRADMGLRLEMSSGDNLALLRRFYASITKKQEIIRYAIDTHSQYHKFLNNLKLQEQQNHQINSQIQQEQPQQNRDTPQKKEPPSSYAPLPLALTPESNKLTPSQQTHLESHTPQFTTYSQFLHCSPQYITLSHNLDTELLKHEKNLQKVKLQIEEQKRMNEEYEGSLRDAETMEKIREAEIMELEKILIAKNGALGLAINHRSSFQSFRDSLVGFAPFKKSISLQGQSPKKKLFQF